MATERKLISKMIQERIPRPPPGWVTRGTVKAPPGGATRPQFKSSLPLTNCDVGKVP